MSVWLIGILSYLYLLILFGLAYWGEKQGQKGQSVVNNSLVYALSLTVYCTAWTYYGSVGQAARNGLEFLTTYIGPTLMMPLWWIVMRKIIRICKVKHITTIADFISSRYGKSASLGVLVSIMSVVGIIPYIALQIKAIGNSFLVITGRSLDEAQSRIFLDDTAFYLTLGLGIFVILFATRNLEATNRHEGVVTAIAFEAIVKLVAFLLLGVFVSFGMYDGFPDIFQKAANYPKLSELFTLSAEKGLSHWFFLNMLSMMAIMFLPRQFQVGVVENIQERHLAKSIWLFPLYLFLINVFVLPIAFVGNMLYAGQGVDADMYVLSIPMSTNQNVLAVMVYLGGFSAASSMIIVSTLALGLMLSNNILMPLMVRIPRLKNHLRTILIYLRRLSAFFILLMAYLYYKLFAEQTALVSIGLISFVAVAQFTPAIIGGIYWQGGGKRGALYGLLAGFGIWFYTLVLPTIVQAGWLPDSLLSEGLFGWAFLRPQALFGLTGLTPIAQSLFWSLFLNTFIYIWASFYFRPSSKEYNQAEIFVNIFKYSTSYEQAVGWKGIAYTSDITSLLEHFLGRERTKQALSDFEGKYQKSEQATSPLYRSQERQPADPSLVNYAEKLLAGVIGAASARVLIASVVKEEEISLEEVYNILYESQQLISINKELKDKSLELERVTIALREANQKLKRADEQKNDFISTVTHEMRTPITSIRALSEILHDHEDLSSEEQKDFLETIIKETKRMSRLISQVLDLEKFDSGTQDFAMQSLELKQLIRESLNAVQQLIREHAIELKIEFPEQDLPIYANQDRLMQVLLNLLSNAIKFCPPKIGKIIIRAKTNDSGKVMLEVEDNGRGIQEEYQELIFDKFYQAEDQTTKKPKGSGLGLAISRKIIQHHKGKIWVKSSRPGKTVFCFTLPLREVSKDL